jgi:hypothetical protein
MTTKLCVLVLWFLLADNTARAQHIYYKSPDYKVINRFWDTTHKLILKNVDSGNIVKKQFSYLLNFYPKMLFKNIVIEYKASPKVAKTKPTFPSIFKMPSERVYHIYFSTSTNSTLDSAILKNLSFNSQLGLIAHQLSQIEDMSTGGFFNFIGWYVKQLTQNGHDRIYKDAELKTLEVGLGYQLLAFNREFDERLKIDNWTDTQGYDNYIKHYKNRAMRPQKIIDLINDLPFYAGKQYK